MYLIQINDETGLIDEVETNSGWRAIKDFSNLAKKKGIKAMTAVALSVDYLSPLSHYMEKDRYARACDEIYGDREALDFEDELILKAIDKYRDLQLDPDLETERINKEIKLRLLEKINEANRNEDDIAIEKYRKSLDSHEKTIETFNKRFDKKLAIEKAVTVTGYELSRIEADIKSRKKSKFVSHGDDAINPNKLGLI